MTAKVENHCMMLHQRIISVDEWERACINCIWYEPHYRAGRGSVRQMIMTSHGTCLKDGSGRGALRRGCKGFETK